jgi:alkylation response protein AidB-like acyl-CoA dehydrogenase
MLLASLENNGDAPATMLALTPMSELEILRDWDVSGMAGTGSNSVRADDVFIPAHRVMPLSEIPADVQITGMPVMIGMARAAVEQFVEGLPGKRVPFSRYPDKHGAWVTHLTVGEAQLKIDTASSVTSGVAELVQSRGEAGVPMTAAEQIQLRAQKAHVTRLAREAVELINSQSGASSIYRHLPIQRIFRDIEAISLHGLNNMPVFAAEYGRMLVGYED